MAQVSQVTAITRDLREERDEEEMGGVKLDVPEGVDVFEVYGTLFFGAVDQFTESIRTLERNPRVFILETRSLLAIDATGLRAVEELAKEFHHHGTHFLISGIHKQPLFAFQQAGLVDLIGEENLCGSIAEALDRARKLSSLVSVPSRQSSAE
jgi:SulP family sulfate permease